MRSPYQFYRILEYFEILATLIPSRAINLFLGLCGSSLSVLWMVFYKDLFWHNYFHSLLFVCGESTSNSVHITHDRKVYSIFHIFSCDQAAIKTLLSIRPSVCPSVRLLHLFDNVSVIVSFSNFQELSTLTDVMSMQKIKVKVTEVMTPFSRFRTVIPVWIHIWWWNDAQGSMLLRRGALLFYKVIHQISRSHGSKNLQFWPKLGIAGL